jgi:hypothetical protein
MFGANFKTKSVIGTTASGQIDPSSAARLQKATALLILFLRSKLNAGLVELMTDAEWFQVAQAARVRVPSPETREAVLRMMRAIETPLAGAIQ